MARPSRPLDIRGFLNSAALQTAPLPIAMGLRTGHLALRNFAPPITEPPMAAAVAPVLGSAWQAAKDLQAGEYAPAVANGVLAGLEAYPGAAVATQAARVKKVNEALKYADKIRSRPLNDKNVRKAFSDAGFTGKETGHEAHHTFPFNGVDRGPPNWRNNPWLVEPRPTAVHRRITGSWGGQPKYGPLRRAWHESSDLVKAGLAGATAYAGDVGEDIFRSDDRPPKTQKSSR